jgi:hypothetical protein
MSVRVGFGTAGALRGFKEFLRQVLALVFPHANCLRKSPRGLRSICSKRIPRWGRGGGGAEWAVGGRKGWLTHQQVHTHHRKTGLRPPVPVRYAIGKGPDCDYLLLKTHDWRVLGY